MEDWDEDKLAEVVGQKHGAEKKLDTAIVRLRKFQPRFIYTNQSVGLLKR